MNRRHFLLSAAILPLGACSQAKQGRFRSFANALYVDMRVVAQKIEQAVVMAQADINAAAAFLEPYIQPVCQIVVSLSTLGNQLIANRVIDANSVNVQKAMAAANGMASDPILVSIANTGALPPNPIEILVGVIKAVTLIMSLTGRAVSPVATVNAGAA